MKKLKSKIEYNRGPAGRQAGMTYIELIVVLSIFAVMTTVIIFNYGEFQAKVDIKNLASSVALKIVEAQKSSLSGKLPSLILASTWKPSYGVYFDTSVPKQFIYFTDLDQNGYLANPNCAGVSECLDKIIITKGDSISALSVIGTGCPAITNLSIVFKRPDSGAIITSNNTPLSCTSLSYAQITIASPKSSTSTIKVYPSGRIQVN